MPVCVISLKGSSGLLTCPTVVMGSPPEIEWRYFPREVVVKCRHWLSAPDRAGPCDSSPSCLVDVCVWFLSNPDEVLLEVSPPVLAAFLLDGFESRGRIVVLNSLVVVFGGNESVSVESEAGSLVLAEVVVVCLDEEKLGCCKSAIAMGVGPKAGVVVICPGRVIP